MYKIYLNYKYNVSWAIINTVLIFVSFFAYVGHVGQATWLLFIDSEKNLISDHVTSVTQTKGDGIVYQ